MDLQQLHQKTGISRRRLRYCLDHKLVPGLPIQLATGRAGRPRQFADDVAFGIVCAAKLLELGLPHQAIRRFLQGLLEITLKGDNGSHELALSAIFRQHWKAYAYLGDGVNVRLTVPEIDYDSAWIAPGNPAPLSRDYQPLTQVVLDLGRIRGQVMGNS